jgi:exodeoxyribonuclease V beta subunit
VDVPALERLLARAAGQALPSLEAEGFRGMVTGIVDLVFEQDGRWYLADYKSNFLGPRLADYRAGRLREAVLERRYDLQYLLYTLALHRYLGQRLPGYSYAAHFGGVYYLFLRGLRPEASPAHGVYFHRPDPDVIAALDADIFGGGP